jgi:hypothetical protein
MAFDHDATPIRMASPRISLYNLASAINHSHPNNMAAVISASTTSA